MDPNLIGFLVSCAAAAAFFAAEWRWPYELHEPFRDLGLNTLATALTLSVGVLVLAGTAWVLTRVAGRVTLLSDVPVVWRVLALIVVGDLGRYAAHRLMHRPAWWRVHRLHHSIEVVNWYSGLRATPVHVTLFAAPMPVLAWLLDLDMVVQAFNLTLATLSNHFMHTNARIPARVQRVLEWLIVTPRFHRLHHSTDRTWRDTNFGAIFTVWDRWFGTHADPERSDGRPLKYGLNEPEAPNWPRTLLGIEFRSPAAS